MERNKEIWAMEEMVEEAMEEEEKAINTPNKDDKVERFAEAYEKLRDGSKQRKRKRKYVKKQVLIRQIVLIMHLPISPLTTHSVNLPESIS